MVPWRWSFRRKLLLLLFTAAVVPLTLITAFVYGTLQREFNQLLRAQFSQALSLQYQLLGRYFDSQKALLRSIAAQDLLLSEIDRAAEGLPFSENAIFISLVSVRRENPFIEKMYIVGNDGRVWFSTATDEIGQQLLQRREIQKAANFRAPYMGEVTVSSLQKRVVPIAAPLIRKRDNAPLGVLVMEINSSVVHSILTAENLAGKEGADKETPEAYVVDAEGFLLVNTRGLGFTHSIQTAPVQNCNAGPRQDRYGVWENGAGEEVVGMVWCRTFDDFSTTLIVEQKKKEAFRLLREFGATITALALLIAAATFFAARLSARTFTAPIEILRRAARELGKGNFEYRVAVATGDELESLAEDFEEMRQRLRIAHQHELFLGKLKSEFISIAAHQLRTPLTAIRWTLEQALENKGSMDEQMFRRALETVIHMADLINDLLNVSRIEEGDFEYHFRCLPLDPLVRERVVAHEDKAHARRITLTLALEGEPLPPVRLDKDKWSMALDNILDNALKYTPEGGRVEVSLRMDAGGITLAVSDTGIGIPRDQLDNIFTKFFRAENAVSFQTEGSGLGLYIVRKIIEAHGGTVRVESREGEGTTVIIHLPQVVFCR